MENFQYGNHTHKLSQLNDNHLVIGSSGYNRTSTIPRHPDSSSLLFQFLHGGGAPPSPRMPVLGGDGSQMRSSAVYRGSAKLEEHVLVMDEFSVENNSGGRRALRASNLNRSLSLMGSNSGGGGSVGWSPLWLENVCKVELCRTWEELGSCCLGSNCQFAHGKEELRPPRLSAKKRPEALMCNSFKCIGSFTNVTDCQSLHRPVALTMTSPEPASLAKPKTQVAAPTKQYCTPDSPVLAITKYKDWSPLDDGIELVLPSPADKEPSRENVEAYIHNTIYSSTTKKRLPVFLEICPE